jgi:hypothetical protein
MGARESVSYSPGGLISLLEIISFFSIGNLHSQLLENSGAFPFRKGYLIAAVKYVKYVL